MIQVSSQVYGFPMKRLGSLKNPINTPLQSPNINKGNAILNFLPFTVSDDKVNIMSLLRESSTLLLKNADIVPRMDG
ncbi:hypothetical protein WP4W18C03_12560 [Pseudomonas putida]|nr:hypothetical protein WP4W18C03_12560 [Pseudomonas putida]